MAKLRTFFVFMMVAMFEIVLD